MTPEREQEIDCKHEYSHCSECCDRAIAATERELDTTREKLRNAENLFTGDPVACEAALVANILRTWEPWRIKRFIEHLLGDAFEERELSAGEA